MVEPAVLIEREVVGLEPTARRSGAGAGDARSRQATSVVPIAATSVPAAWPAPAQPHALRARRSAQLPGQLSLQVAPLPEVPVELDWKAQPRLWGHAYHPMCSYLASFPAALAHAFIARYTRPGDVVVDPFSGRGTTPLQACAEGRIGVGNDLNPLAHLLTAAKLDPPTGRALESRLAHLRLDWSFEMERWRELASAIVRGDAVQVPPGFGDGPRAGTHDVPPEVALHFHPRTLGQLLFVRGRLDLADPADRFVAGAIAGILHGKRPGYLSELMPNGFSMAPGYARDYAARTGFVAPDRDLFILLGAKLRRLARDGRPAAPGIALLGDARDAGARARAALRERGLPDRARLVVTSPPYLRVIKYGSFNWLRAWLFGFSAAEIDAALDHWHRRGPYLEFLRDVLAGLRPVLAHDAVIAMVLGDVEADGGHAVADGVPIGLADDAWERAARPQGYLLAGVVRDDVPAPRKLTRLWGEQAGRATNVDRILLLATSEAGRRRALAGAPVPVDWTWPPRR